MSSIPPLYFAKPALLMWSSMTDKLLVSSNLHPIDKDSRNGTGEPKAVRPGLGHGGTGAKGG